MIKKWFVAYSLQGIGLSALMIIISLFAVTGLSGNVRSATTAAALYSTGTLFGSLFVGSILDRKNTYKEVVFIGLTIGSITAGIMPFSLNLKMYYLMAVLLGFSISMINPAITLYLSRHLNEIEYRKYISNINLGNSIGITVGTFLGGLVLTYLPTLTEIEKMKVVFLLSALIFAVSAIISSETRTKNNKKERRPKRFSISVRPIFASMRMIPRNIAFTFNFSIFSKEIKLYLTGTFITFFGANLFFAPLPIYLKEFMQIKSGTIFLMYAYSNIAATIAYLFTQWAMKRFRDFSIMQTVLWIRIFSFFGIIFFGIAHNYIGTLITFILISFTWPFFYIPATVQATNLAKPENKGRILGVFNMIISLAVIIASFLSGVLALRFGYFIVFVLGAGLLLMGERLTRVVANIVPIPENIQKAIKEREKDKKIVRFKKLIKNGLL
jgi:MFS family permease